MKKLTTLFVISALCVLCAVFAVGASAEENTLSIQYGNVAYNEMTQLAFTISGEAPTGSTIGIAVWNSDVEGEKTAASASYFSFDAKTLDEKTYYLTKGIAAPDMSTKITVAPALKDADGNVTVAGALVNYSIYDYVMDRLDDENLTEVQVKLYTKLVYYGNSAEKILGDKTVDFPLFVAKGGEAGKLGHEMAFADENGGAVIRANSVNEDGDYFLYWEAKDGSKIYDRVTYVEATEGNNVYTAKYGEASVSPYAGAVTYDGYTPGRIQYTPSSGTPSTKNGHYYLWQEKYTTDRLIRSIITFEVESETDTTVKNYTNIEIKETDDCNKYLAYDKTFAVDYMNVGAELQIFNLGDKNEEKLDFDIAINETATNEPMSFYVYYTTGSATKSLRLYIRYDASGNLYVSNQNNFGDGIARYAGKFERGEKISLSAEIVSENELALSVNGKALTADAKGTELGNFTIETVDLTKGYIASLKFEVYSYAYAKFDLYNFSFVDTDKFN